MRKIETMIGSALLLSVLLVGCSGGEEKEGVKDQKDAGDTVTTASADSLYTEYCLNCHGDEMNRMNVDLNTIKDRLGEDEIFDIIKNGKAAMPGSLVNDAENTVLTKWLLEQ